MTHQDEATDRLRRALWAFQAAQNQLLGAHRRLKGLPPAEVDAFWRGPGRRFEAGMRTTAAEVVAAFKRFSAVPRGTAAVPAAASAARAARPWLRTRA